MLFVKGGLMIKLLFCPVCGSSHSQKFWAMPGYRLSRCLRCGMVWDHIPPTKILAQYQESYFVNENPKGGYSNYFESMSINRRTFSDRLGKIEKKLGRKGRFLDVGCALGDCLVEAKRLGWKEAEGLEVSDYGYKYSKDRGLEVRKGTLGKDTFSPASFDVVAYQDVIEHITNPVDELNKVYRILKPGGIVFLVTPDIEGFWSKLLGPLWYHYKPGEHVVYFSQKTIKDALSKAGFENIETGKTYHVLSLEYILNRLRYYFPWFFEILLKLIVKTPFRKIPFRAYTGELEAWGLKLG